MNVDRILDAFSRRHVACLLIGGVNFLLRHAPVLTFDVDLWLEDLPENLARGEAALADLNAQWGPSEQDWRPVGELPPGWLDRQMVYCLTSDHGPIDVFRSVHGLDSWGACRERSIVVRTAAGTEFRGLCDEDMLRCQLALPEGQRRADRVAALEEAIQRRTP